MECYDIALPSLVGYQLLSCFISQKNINITVAFREKEIDIVTLF